jgi:hypothetical protein
VSGAAQFTESTPLVPHEVPPRAFARTLMHGAIVGGAATRRAIRKMDAWKNAQARGVRARQREKSTRLKAIKPCSRGCEQRIRLITTSDDLKRRARARARGCISRRALDTKVRRREAARSARATGSHAERSASSRGRLVARGALRERRRAAEVDGERGRFENALAQRRSRQARPPSAGGARVRARKKRGSLQHERALT